MEKYLVSNSNFVYRINNKVYNSYTIDTNKSIIILSVIITIMAWYETLEERYVGRIVPSTIYTTRPQLFSFVRELLQGHNTHIHIPQWDNNTQTSRIVAEYTLTLSSITDNIVMFFSPYHPIIVYDSSNTIVGVLSEEGFAARTQQVGAFLPDNLEVMFADPIAYFESVGMRYGRCLVCKRKLTADVSIERAMGPVCYQRVERAQEYLRSMVLEDVAELAEARNEHVGIDSVDDRPSELLTSREHNGLISFNAQLKRYYRAGFYIDATGTLCFSKKHAQPCYRAPMMIKGHTQKDIHLRPVASADYTRLASTIVRITKNITDNNEISPYITSTASLSIHISDFARAVDDNELIIVERPAIPILIDPAKTPNDAPVTILKTTAAVKSTVPQKAEYSESTAQPSRKISEKLPSATYEISSDGSELLLFRFPREVMKILRTIPGARYDRLSGRMIIPITERQVVENIVTLRTA